MTTMKEWQDEEKNLKLLRAAVDRLAERIKAGMPDDEYLEHRQGLRNLCAKLFPDRLELFDMIYGSRFERLRRQFPRSPTI